MHRKAWDVVYDIDRTYVEKSKVHWILKVDKGRLIGLCVGKVGEVIGYGEPILYPKANIQFCHKVSFHGIYYRIEQALQARKHKKGTHQESNTGIRILVREHQRPNAKRD